MSNEEVKNFKIRLDTSALEKSISNIDGVFKQILNKINDLNRRSVYKLSVDELNKQIESIENKLASLIKSKKEISFLPFSKELESKMSFLDARIKELTKEKSVRLTFKETNIKTLKDINNKIGEINFDNLLESGTEMLEKLGASVENIAIGISKSIEKVKKDTADFLDSISKSIDDFSVDKMLNGIGKSIKDIISNCKEVDVIKKIFDSIKDLGEKSLDIFENISNVNLESIINSGKNLIDNLASNIGNFGNSIMNAFQSGKETVSNFFESLKNGSIDAGDIIKGVGDTFNKLMSDDTASKFIEKSLKSLGEGGATAYGVLKQISSLDFSSIADQTKDLMETFKNKDDGTEASIEDKVQKSLEIAKTGVNAIAGIFSSVYSDELKEAENALKIENEMIDNALNEKTKKIEENLEAKKEMYDEELEEIEGRELEREEIITETQSKIEEVNNEMKNASSEEEYARLEAKKEALEQNLADELALREQDNLAKEEIENKNKIAESQARIEKEAAENDTRNKKLAAQKNFAKKEAEIKRKQAIADKVTASFNAAISMAQGITAAAASGATYGPAAPFMIPFMISLVTVAGIAQIAAIAQSPLPEIPSFAKGGYVGKDNDGIFNFLPKSKNKNDRTLIWAAEGERILNPYETAMYEKMTSSDTYNSPVININTTVNASTGSTAREIADVASKEITKQVVLQITRGYA